MISKTISISKKVNKLDDVAALIYTWIQPHTDDYGCMDGDADSIKAIVVPRRDYTEKQVDKALEDMVDLGLLVRYSVDGDKYIQIDKFDEHQTFRSDRPRRSEYPTPDQANGTPETPKGKPKGVKRQSKLSEVKLSEVKLSEEKQSDGKIEYGESKNVKLTIEEYQKLVEVIGEQNTHILIEEMDDYLGTMTPKKAENKYASHYKALRNWARRKSVEMKGGGKGKNIISSS